MTSPPPPWSPPPIIPKSPIAFPFFGVAFVRAAPTCSLHGEKHSGDPPFFCSPPYQLRRLNPQSEDDYGSLLRALRFLHHCSGPLLSPALPSAAEFDSDVRLNPRAIWNPGAPEQTKSLNSAPTVLKVRFNLSNLSSFPPASHFVATSCVRTSCPPLFPSFFQWKGFFGPRPNRYVVD